MAKDLRELASRVQRYKKAVLTVVPAAVSERIVTQLQDEGPNWTGEFMNAWRILNGENTAEPVLGRSPNLFGPKPAYSPAEPVRQFASPSPTIAFVSPAPNLYVAHTLSNASAHRLVAMDIDLTYFRDPVTAPQDWWLTYIGGGQLQATLGITVAQSLGGIVL